MQILRKYKVKKSILQVENISVIKQKIKQKGKAEKMSGFRMFVELRELSCSHNPKTPQIRS